MRKLFMVIFGLLLMAFCYHSPPQVQVENSDEISYDLPGETASVPIIKTVIIGAEYSVIKGPMKVVSIYNYNSQDAVPNELGITFLAEVDVGSKEELMSLTKNLRTPGASHNNNAGITRVLSLWPNSNGERHAARNAVT